MGSSGKSGALFYYTKDRKYMLKSISAREFKILINPKVLKDFLVHTDSNPESLLVRFLGAYTLEWRDPEHTKCHFYSPKTISHIVVMNNIFEHFDVGLRFDLKGSFKSRKCLEDDAKIEEYEADA